MDTVTLLYETLSRLDGGFDGRWGRGATAYAMSKHLGISQKKAKALLVSLEAFNFAWSSVHLHGRRPSSTHYYLNDFGKRFLAMYHIAANNPKNTGQPALAGWDEIMRGNVA